MIARPLADRQWSPPVTAKSETAMIAANPTIPAATVVRDGMAVDG